MFSETRYALNGDLRVAYRASREAPRDIVFVHPAGNCEVFPELFVGLRVAEVSGLRVADVDFLRGVVKPE